MHLATALELASSRYPETDAVLHAGKRWSYGAWNRRVNAVAWGLQRAGIRPGDRVALCALNGEPAATTYFAVQKAGAAAVWLNARWKGPELAYAMDDAAVTGVLYDRAAAPEVGRALATCQVKPVRIADSGEAADLAAGDFLYQDVAAGLPAEAPEVPRLPSATATILYTSGTSGRPKGVPRSHASDYHAALAMIVEHRWVRFERTLGVMPLYHTMGLHTLITMVVLNGACVLCSRFDPGECLRLVEAERVTALFLVPAAFHDLVGHVRSTGGRAPRVSKLAYAGAPMAPSLAGQCRATFRPDVFLNHYGCTETHVIAVNHDLEKKPSAVGRPALHSRIRVVTADPDRPVPPTEEVPPGTVGEIVVDTSILPQAFSGYLNRSEATAQALRDGWYFTRDLGFVDTDGDLHVLGRLDDMIISGGENVYPAEVEAVLLAHPQVRDAAVVGLPDERWGETVAAFVVPASGDLDAAALDRFCLSSRELARFKRPRRYVFVEEIPRSPSGKVLRSLLKKAGQYRPAPRALEAIETGRAGC